MSLALLQMLRSRGDDEAVNTQPLAEESLKNARRWTFREDFDIETDDIEILIANSMSNNSLRLVSKIILSDDTYSGSVDLNVSGVGTGTPLPFRNDLIDGDPVDPPDGITVESGGTYSGGSNSLPIRTTGGTGRGTNRTPLNQIPTATARIEPGGSLHYTLSNSSGNPNTVTFEAIIAER